MVDGPGDVHHLDELAEVPPEAGVHAGGPLLVAQLLEEGQGLLPVRHALSEVEASHVHEVGQPAQQVGPPLRLAPVRLHEVEGRLPVNGRLLQGQHAGGRLSRPQGPIDGLIGRARPAGLPVMDSESTGLRLGFLSVDGLDGLGRPQVEALLAGLGLLPEQGVAHEGVAEAVAGRRATGDFGHEAGSDCFLHAFEHGLLVHPRHAGQHVELEVPPEDGGVGEDGVSPLRQA